MKLSAHVKDRLALLGTTVGCIALMVGWLSLDNYYKQQKSSDDLRHGVIGQCIMDGGTRSSCGGD